MLVPVLRFFQRYAAVFAIFAGVYARRWVLPDGGQWWLELGVTVAAAGAVYFLLYKDGVSDNRQGPEARLRIIEIIGFSVLFWLNVMIGLLLLFLLASDSATDLLPFGQSIDWPIALAIVALVLAAIVYALGLRAAIRKRRRHPFLN
jgi:hypothetical protein